MIDNYDSFTYNLVQYLGQCGARVHTVRNDRITLAQVEALRPTGIVLSPGPGNPQKNPRCLGVGADVLKELSKNVPTLGVCLGHQAIGSAFGARVVPSKTLMHGKTSLVHHQGQGLFSGLPDPLSVGRYHSLALDGASLPEALRVTARSEDGEIMAVQHRDYPIYGVQFHPESVLSPQGQALLHNFLKLSQERKA